MAVLSTVTVLSIAFRCSRYILEVYSVSLHILIKVSLFSARPLLWAWLQQNWISWNTISQFLLCVCGLEVLRRSIFAIFSALHIGNCEVFDWCFTLVRPRVACLWLFTKKDNSSWASASAALDQGAVFYLLNRNCSTHILWVLCSQTSYQYGLQERQLVKVEVSGWTQS